MERQQRESLSFDELQELLRVVDRIEAKALIELAVTTGIRREDVANIDLANVDLEKGELRFWEEKKNRWWKVYLEPQVVTTLRMYINTLPKGQQKLFAFTGRTAYNYLQKYLKKAGIKKKIPFHALRNTFVRLSKKMGRDVKYVQKQTGDTARVILEHYDDYDDDEMREITKNRSILK